MRNAARRIGRLAGLVLAALVGAWPAAAQDAVYYYHTDALGSVRAVTDASGAVVRRDDYFPFGDGPVGTTAGADSVRFTGKPRDAETGLDYFGARYYAQRTGRFTTVDPALNIDAALTDPQRWNRYAYSLNNPIRYLDPDGKELSTPAAFSTKAFQQQTADNLRALGKVLINIGRSINSPGHMTPDAEARYFEQPDSASEASRMRFFDLVLTAAPALFGPRGQAGALRSVGSIDDVIAAPSVLRGGVTPEQLMSRLGTVPETWRVEKLGDGRHEGFGFLLREYKIGPKRMEPTGRMIRWHPGGGHHGEGAYWKVVDYNTVSGEIR